MTVEQQTAAREVTIAETLEVFGAGKITINAERHFRTRLAVQSGVHTEAPDTARLLRAGAAIFHG